MTKSGVRAPRSKTTSVSGAVAGMSTRAGMLNSRNGSPCRARAPESSFFLEGTPCPAGASRRRPDGTGGLDRRVAWIAVHQTAYCWSMRVHVVSDVHGRCDALRRAADGADALICLGDLLLFLDYLDHSRGIF